MGLREAFAFKPNGVTVSAIRSPVAYSISTGVLVLAMGVVGLRDFGWAWALTVGLLATLLVGSGNWLIWRQGGPAYRWAQRKMPPEMAESAGLPLK
jgi:hypothetical protein